jgi:hypothetical protein
MMVKLKRPFNQRKGVRQVKLKILQGSKNHKHHGDFKFQFVHDLAGPDHSKATLAYEGKFTFFDRTTNPLNVPQAQPIENLWGILAQKIYEGGWEAKTQQELISRIQSQMKKFDSIFLQNLMRRV